MAVIIQIIVLVAACPSLAYGQRFVNEFLSIYWMLENTIATEASFEPLRSCRSYLKRLNDSCMEDDFNILTTAAISVDIMSLFIRNAHALYFVLFDRNGTILTERCGGSTQITDLRVSGGTSDSERTLGDYLSYSCYTRKDGIAVMDNLVVGICQNVLQEMSDMCKLQNCSFETNFTVRGDNKTFTVTHMEYKYGISYSDNESVSQECSKVAAGVDCNCPVPTSDSVTCADVPTTLNPASTESQRSTDRVQSGGAAEKVGFIALGLIIGAVIATVICCVIRRLQVKSFSSKTSINRKLTSISKFSDNSTSSVVHGRLYSTSEDPGKRIDNPDVHPPKGSDPTKAGNYESSTYQGKPDHLYISIQGESQYPDADHVRRENTFEKSKSDHVYHHLNERHGPQKAYDNPANIYLELDDNYDPDKGDNKRSDPYDHLSGVRDKSKYPHPTAPPMASSGEITDSERSKDQSLIPGKNEGRQKEAGKLQNVDVGRNVPKMDNYFILEKPSEHDT